MARRIRRATMLMGCALAAALAAQAQGAALRAGVAKADITPPPSLAMYGFFSRIKNDQRAVGALDPLYARVLVLEAGQKRLALVTLDLGRTFGAARLDELRQAARRQSRISYLVVTASHTHSGPNIVDDDPPGEAPAWETAALQKIESAIAHACERLQPVRIGVGYGSVEIGYNRRRVNPDGSVTMLWQNPSKLPTAPVDPTVAVMRVDTMAAKPLAILVNYACHPVVFGADNLRYSADFPGVMAQVVERAFASRPLCFFLQGAAGDINPFYAGTPVAQHAAEKRDWTGEQLGLEAAKVAKGIETQADPQPSLQFAEDILRVPVRWDPEKFRDGLIAAFGPKIFEDHADLFRDKPWRELDLPVTTFLIDRRIAFAAMPGEPFVNFQIAWRARCPVRDSFFLGYTNGYFDYLPTLRAASQGGYGAGDSDTYVAVGAGERMLDRSLIRIYQMLDRLGDLPEDLPGK